MDIILAIAALCQVSGSRSVVAYASQLECQKYYIDCLLRDTTSNRAEHKLAMCVKEKKE